MANLGSINLYSFLTGKSAITSLISTRVYPQMLPQNAILPAITYHCYGVDSTYYTTGAANWAEGRWQIDIWANTLVSVTAIGEAVRNALQGYSGSIGSATVHVVILENQQTLYEPPVRSDDQPIHHLAQQYKIIYPESSPTLT